MKSKVYFSSLAANHFKMPFDIIEHLWDKAEILGIDKGGHVDLKIHFGGFANLNYIRPQFLLPIIQKVLQRNAYPFLTDTNTLYQAIQIFRESVRFPKFQRI